MNAITGLTSAPVARMPVLGERVHAIAITRFTRRLSVIRPSGA
jgi:type II secretory pathway component PulF